MALRLGSHGFAITNLQKNLNLLGNHLAEDGDYGPKTEAAVKAFQSKHNLVADGIVGPITQKALTKAIVAVVTAPKPTPAPTPVPAPVPPTGKVTRAQFVDYLVDLIQADIDAGLHESNGANRSPQIDGFNKRAGVPMGSSYCASGGTSRFDDTCKHFGLKNPLGVRAASQDMRKSPPIPKKYIRPEGALGKKGDAGILQNANDTEHGHYTVLKEDQVAQPKFKTVEYNTNLAGSSNGEGAYNHIRSTVDGSAANSGKKFICFTDLPQWALDYNGITN